MRRAAAFAAVSLLIFSITISLASLSLRLWAAWSASSRPGRARSATANLLRRLCRVFARELSGERCNHYSLYDSTLGAPKMEN